MGTAMRLANNPLLAPRHWRRIIEAGVALTAASAATRLLPFNRYIHLGARPLTRARRPGDPEIASIVEAVGRRLPFRAVCLQQGLALQWLLRRRGVDAVLHYGIQLPTDGDILAHVWVSVDGKVLLGAPQHAGFAEVARFPAQRDLAANDRPSPA